MRAEEVIEDIHTQLDNYNTGFIRDPLQALNNIEAICERWEYW